MVRVVVVQMKVKLFKIVLKEAKQGVEVDVKYLQEDIKLFGVEQI